MPDSLAAQPDLGVVLVAPEIPHNTGAVGRLCVGLGVSLHLIEPLGFQLTEARVRRVGLDYWAHVDLAVHASWTAFLETIRPEGLFFASTRGQRSYLDYTFAPGSFIVFGNETRGLPDTFYTRYSDKLYSIPMPGRYARSHNLSNAVAIVAYEAYRQLCRGSVDTPPLPE